MNITLAFKLSLGSLAAAAGLFVAAGFAMAEGKPAEKPMFRSSDTQPRNGRIVGGTPSPTGANPWQVALISSTGRFFCGGSVIAPTLVVTAAHCVDDFPTGLRVLVGTNRLNSGGRLIPVSSIQVHPGWSPTDGVGARDDNDVALLRLDFPANVTAIRLATPQLAATLERVGTRATISGWGATSEGGSGSTNLLQAVVPIVSQASCAASYGTSSITTRMICAGFTQGGTDTCQGDSGGPMVVRSNGVPYLVGITSFGRGCARPNFPGVYARVSQLNSWILGNRSCYVAGLRPNIRQPANFDCTQIPPSDDGSTLTRVSLGFPVKFGALTYRDLWVNNNGNLTFTNRMSTFTPGRLSLVGQPIIAPFSLSLLWSGHHRWPAGLHGDLAGCRLLLQSV
ncbi:MAG: serine protease [Rhizobiaceae bacterium]|nr:serine protease [Rhizobiaceae bacterium]